MSKTFTPKPGDKWTRDGDGDLWLYRDKKCLLFNRGEVHESGGTFRFPGETDLPTPDAHAQLREWGYEVRGDAATSTTTPSGMVIETRYVFPGEYRIDPPITEDRVREIVSQMLAAQPTPAEVREAAKVASDPNTKWHNITTKIVDPEKEAVAPEPVRWSDICDTPHSLRVAIDGPIMAVSPAWTGERVVIMDVPANIAAPEPDWKGLLERVCDAADFVIDTDETPERNCSCHIDPPCLDCEEYAGRRQAIDELNAAIAAARKAVGK